MNFWIIFISCFESKNDTDELLQNQVNNFKPTEYNRQIQKFEFIELHKVKWGCGAKERIKNENGFIPCFVVLKHLTVFFEFLGKMKINPEQNCQQNKNRMGIHTFYYDNTKLYSVEKRKSGERKI